MNAVVYARFSSHSQTEQSIEGQLKTCEEFAQRNGYIIVDEYIDRAISGTTDARPAFLRMIEDSARGGFQYVLVYQLDRFARNRYDSAIYKSKLKRNGVRVLSAKENITDDASGILVEGLLESMAEYYSAELSQKIRRGMDLNADKCLCTGGNVALGYKIAPDKSFLVDTETAPVVVKVFEMYASGSTVTEICQKLNEKGYRTARGAVFNKNSLTKMLQNKRYIGVYTYKGRETPGGMPQIVPDELFSAVQERLAVNKKAPARAKAHQEYLLTTKLFCGYCKDMMRGYCGTGKSGKVHYYYACNSMIKKKCGKHTIKKETIEDLVIEACRQQLTPENIDRIAEGVVAICEQENDDFEIKRLEKLIKTNERRRSNLVNTLSECEFEAVRNTIYDEILKLSEEAKELEGQLSLEKSRRVTLTVPEIKYFLSQLKNKKIDTLAYRKTMINVFVNRVYLYENRAVIVFNTGNKPVTVDDKLLEKIEGYDKQYTGSFNLTMVEQQSLKANPMFFIGGFVIAIGLANNQPNYTLQGIQ